MTLDELLTTIAVESVQGDLDTEVGGLTIDSRQVNPGDVFVALVGQTADGHRFLDEAVERGAVAVVSERPPERTDVAWIQALNARVAVGQLSSRLAGEPAKAIDLVGVTGTNGKTTTAFLLDSIFGHLAPPSAMMGTVIHRIGEESSPARFTTPEAPEVQSFLARAVEAQCRYGVLEVSSHGLAMGRIAGTEFACAVFTNLSRDHLDFHSDMESYFAAKRALFEQYLRPGATAVVCVDDTYGIRLAETLSSPVCTFGFSTDADIRCEEMEASFEGLDLRIRERGGVRRIKSPLIGRHNALNILAAFGAGLCLNFRAEELVRAIERVDGVPGRYEKVEAGQRFHVIVDYAHTDDALRNLLETTRKLPHRRILTVFGCGGDRDISKRPLMGAVASRLSDVVVLTSDNPRSEDPLAIIQEIELGTKGARSKAEVLIEPDRRRAIAKALSLAAEGDVLLISGKGHEPYQVTREGVSSFDDREVVREILNGGVAQRKGE
jgi:UDP-N-acetylmuramoyl-L-alanyl-D-glutamate--2,6-diaminopimelate ligase